MIKPIGAILANLIAFVSIFSFLDAICIWFFSMLDLENFGLAVGNFSLKDIKKKLFYIFVLKKSILQYLFWPFAFLMVKLI